MIRMQRLDEAGAPTGEPYELAGLIQSVDLQMRPLPSDECSAFDVRTVRPVTFTATITPSKMLARLLLGPDLMVRWRRAVRHRARIVVVPKRRRKHGRIGVYR